MTGRAPEGFAMRCWTCFAVDFYPTNDGDQACSDCGRHNPNGSTLGRVCACPCRVSLAGRSRATKYLDHRHAQRAYRGRVKSAATAAGLPSNLSLQAVRASSSTTTHNGDAQNGRSAPRRRRRPDLRVSYRKAVDAVASHVGDPGEAEGVLRPLLSPAQQRSLEGRA